QTGSNRAWRAAVWCCDTATCVQHIDFVDTTPPMISCPPDKHLNCGDPTDPSKTGSATATDNCGGVVQISSTDAGTPAGCAGVPEIRRASGRAGGWGHART